MSTVQNPSFHREEEESPCEACGFRPQDVDAGIFGLLCARCALEILQGRCEDCGGELTHWPGECIQPPLDPQ